MNSIASWLRAAAWLLAFTVSASASAQLVSGRDYRPITPPQPTDSGKRVEVLEFFWYACPHCNALQPSLRNWLKQKPADVEFKRVPAVLDKSWLSLAWAYYALDAVGAVDKLHYEVFAAIHEQRQRLSEPPVLFDWVAKQGIDRQKFIDTYNSFGVKNRGARAMELTRNYDLMGTPALAIDGKYMVAPSMTLKADKTVDYDRYFQVVDQLIAMARKERTGK